MAARVLDTGPRELGEAAPSPNAKPALASVLASFSFFEDYIYLWGGGGTEGGRETSM